MAPAQQALRSLDEHVHSFTESVPDVRATDPER
jgi:hypothetical protein